MRSLSILTFALLAAACQSAAPYGERGPDDRPGASASEDRRPRNRPFVSVEYDAFRAEGTGGIEGQVFLRTRGGDVKFGAGSLVHLVPVTSYSEEWFEREVLGDEPLEERDARAEHFHWVVRADGFGEFEFRRLPAGEYFLASEVRWEVQARNGDLHPAGGWAHGRVRVVDGEVSRAIVTR